MQKKHGHCSRDIYDFVRYNSDLREYFAGIVFKQTFIIKPNYDNISRDDNKIPSLRNIENHALNGRGCKDEWEY